MRPLSASCLLLFASIPLFAATNATVTQIQQTYNTDTTLDINIDLNNTPNPNIGSTDGMTVECNTAGDNCYSGAIWYGYNTLTLNNNSTLTVNLTATGTYGGWAAVFFRGKGGQTYTMNGGTFVLNLLSYAKVTSDIPIEGVFMTRRGPSDLATQFIFNSDVIVTATDQFYITRGIFNVNDGSGGYQFNGNTYIDVSQMQESEGWKGSGIGFRSITSVGGDGYFYVNYNPTTKTTYNVNNIVQLKGDISVELTSTDKADAVIHLTNPQSFFQGRFSLQGQANAELLLDGGGKWYLTANSAVRKLNMYNSSDSIANQYGNTEKISTVDFTRIADDGTISRLTSGAAFVKRTLNTASINGNYGVFKLMVDIPSGTADTVSTASLSGTHYIQVFQNINNLSFDLGGKQITVAHADIVQGDFVGLTAIAGIYDYTPTITSVTAANGAGKDWVLTAIQYEPNQTAKTLVNLLSTPYRIFRVEADTLNHRIDDLLYPPAKFGVWAKAYGGGIYQKNDIGGQTSQNLFFSFQGGFDYGRNIGNIRYFYGGSFDFLRMYGSDAGYNGQSDSYGPGFYAGYIDNDALFLDAKVKYVVTNFRNNLYQSQSPVNFYGHILMADFRIGYSLYPFRNARKKVGEVCKKGNDGRLFCRNDTSTGYVRDPSFYIQPFFSLTPGVIFGQNFSFTDVTSQFRVTSTLDTTAALITKIGVLGVKRYQYERYAVRARSFISYSYDMNLGGKITLIDNANIPLYNSSDQGSHRISLGLGADVLFLDDSLKLYADFSTEFFSKLNTYWLFSGGLRYKFGQPPSYRKKSLTYRPKSPAKQKSLSQRLRPYQRVDNPSSSSYNSQNHFEEKNSGYIRQAPRVR